MAFQQPFCLQCFAVGAGFQQGDSLGLCNEQEGTECLNTEIMSFCKQQNILGSQPWLSTVDSFMFNNMPKVLSLASL